MEKLQALTMTIGWTLIRVTFGFYLAYAHGFDKVFGHAADGTANAVKFSAGVAKLGHPFDWAPLAFAWAAALSEFLGASLLAAGLFTRPAAFFVLFTMAVAIRHHLADGLKDAESAMLYAVPALAFLLGGPGPIALDPIAKKILPMFRKKKEAS